MYEREKERLGGGQVGQRERSGREIDRKRVWKKSESASARECERKTACV